LARFLLAKPIGFNFKPGRENDIFLPGLPTTDAQGVCHTLSIVSAPLHGELVVAASLDALSSA
jgi:hypothetical protein